MFNSCPRKHYLVGGGGGGGEFEPPEHLLVMDLLLINVHAYLHTYMVITLPRLISINRGEIIL